MTADEWDPHAHAGATDPWTSAAAAESLANGGTVSIREALTAAYRAAGEDGLTAEEAADAIGGAGRNAGPWKRVSDLDRAGVIVDSGRTRPGRSGRAQRVLVIAPPAPAAPDPAPPPDGPTPLEGQLSLEELLR